MLHVVALIATLAIQDPQVDPQVDPPQADTKVDVVTLKNGSELRGRIVQEADDFVMIETAPGTRVGVARSRTVSIERGLPVEDEEAWTNEASSEDRDVWSVLHDADGRAVGWIHETNTTDGRGGRRVGEEWLFSDENTRTELTMLETIDAGGAAQSCFLHERVVSGDRLVSERVLRAEVEAGKLRVSSRSTTEDRREVYDFPDGARFPLSLRDELRRHPTGHHVRSTLLVFDPNTEQFTRQTFDLGRSRRVTVEGTTRVVRVMTAEASGVRSAEWLDAASHTVRREINGPALVAVPTREAEARRLARQRTQMFPGGFRTEPGERFGLWLPGPHWQFVEDPRAGQLSAVARLDDARVSLVAFPHLSTDLGARSAADAVLRWMRLVDRKLHVVDRTSGSWRRAPMVSMELRTERAKSPSRTRAVRVDVFQMDGQWFSLCCEAPLATSKPMQREFDWIRDRLELRREAFDPEPRGALADRRK